MTDTLEKIEAIEQTVRLIAMMADEQTRHALLETADRMQRLAATPAAPTINVNAIDRKLIVTDAMVEAACDAFDSVSSADEFPFPVVQADMRAALTAAMLAKGDSDGR